MQQEATNLRRGDSWLHGFLLPFASLLPDEKIPSALDALRPAVAFYKEHGITIRRLLTDRGSTYRSKLFASTCAYQWNCQPPPALPCGLPSAGYLAPLGSVPLSAVNL